MNLQIRFAVFAALLVVGGTRLAVAEEVDRVLAVAAGRAITWSAILREANAEAFLAGQPPVELRLADSGVTGQLQDVGERLANQLVLERARRNSALATAEPQGEAEGELAQIGRAHV